LYRKLFAILAALSFIGFLNLIFAYEGKRDVTEFATSAFWGGWFFIFVASYYHSRVMHIESIKYYRNKIIANNSLENRRA